MSKQRKDIKYVSIEDVIKDKHIKLIQKAFDKRINKETTYNKFENILDGTALSPFRCGTNRYVFNHSDYKKHVVKIAADPHGVRANRREFYNSSIHERLTQSLSISDDGIILVQEKIKPITKWSVFEDHWKKIDKLLWELHEYFLLVDLSMTSKSMGNFGLRELKDGDYEVVVCDHGDIVPLDDYQLKVINYDEESTVSLRCRNYPEHDGKECGGKLVPHGDWEFLQCKKCKKIIRFSDAHADIAGDIIHGGQKEKAFHKSIDNASIAEFIRLQDERDKRFIKESMSSTKNNILKEDKSMDYEKIEWNGKVYRIPRDPENPFSELMLGNFRNGISTLEEYFRAVDEDMDKWEVKNVPRFEEYDTEESDEEYDEDEYEDVTYTDEDVEYIDESEFVEVTDDDEESDEEMEDDDESWEETEDSFIPPQRPSRGELRFIGTEDESTSLLNDILDSDDDNESYDVFDYTLSELVSSENEDIISDINQLSERLDTLFHNNTVNVFVATSNLDVATMCIKEDYIPLDNDAFTQMILCYQYIATLYNNDYLEDSTKLDSLLGSNELDALKKIIFPVYERTIQNILTELRANIILLENNGFVGTDGFLDFMNTFTVEKLLDMYTELNRSGSKHAFILSSVMYQLPHTISSQFKDLILESVIHKELSDLKDRLIVVSFNNNGKVQSVTIDLYTHIRELINRNIIDNEKAYIVDVIGIDTWTEGSDIDYAKVYDNMYSVGE